MKLLEQFLYFSVGFASRTGEKLTCIIQSLIEQGKISCAEGKEILDDYAEKAKNLTDKFDQKLEEFVVEVMEKLDFANEEDIIKLKKRIEIINEKMSKKLL